MGPSALDMASACLTCSRLVYVSVSAEVTRPRIFATSELSSWRFEIVLRKFARSDLANLDTKHHAPPLGFARSDPANLLAPLRASTDFRPHWGGPTTNC